MVKVQRSIATLLLVTLRSLRCASYHANPQSSYFASGNPYATLLVRRTPFSQAKSGVLSANTTIKQKSTEWCFLAFMVEVRRFELRASWSRTMRATSCATPRFGKILSFLQVVKSVVKVKFCEKF